ncbi:heavy metal translocating P-type ATPase [Pontivivens insulae]|uniref:Copper-exporting P-type ATPase A n=1 Tax=Pontivivens insulae TaxID=1639689 RepID=A0A2R8AFY9_9RHOB|nr:heavy metal translocating P-type ATPase [Pontivivens insulae]RED12233.1 Cu2+-exporting ATPase [Pontivivens insulae]SPF30990.1 Copper-exporting P-type ATPase A [Pontivivens insulae]
MSCCANLVDTTVAGSAADAPRNSHLEDIARSAQIDADGTAHLVVSATAINCGACVRTLERGLAALDGVQAVRVNLTLRRITLQLANAAQIGAVLDEMQRLGYPATLVDDAALGREDAEAKTLLQALAVSGFAAGNVMLLSVSVWAGAEGATRDLFHMLSAMIAVPIVGWAGQTFFRSAIAALRAGRLNMDVPIALALILSLTMSVVETARGGEEVYFDAALTLTFFLLVGRYLDRLMRARARRAVVSLGRLAARGAYRVDPEHGLEWIAVEDIQPGMVLRLAVGDRAPVNGVICNGRTTLDRALVSGESEPVAGEIGSEVEAGVLNLSGPIELRATARAEDSFLADVMKMMDVAEQGRAGCRRIADRAAALYAPVVHLLALITFAGWMIAGAGAHESLFIAISVLIITCPCALALAVPVVQVIAAARLFEAGILLKDGSGLERLAQADTVVFDKTGTLTTGIPGIRALGTLTMPDVALTLARHSSHPASRALARELNSAREVELVDIFEEAGQGIEGRLPDGRVARLGRPEWVAKIALDLPSAQASTAFAIAGERACGFALAEVLRPGAHQTIWELVADVEGVALLSGDAPHAVNKVARQLGIEAAQARLTPQAKVARIAELQADGARVVMVGDGLNDSPALAAAHVSIAPSSASDVGRMAADFVFTRPSLRAVPQAMDIARRAARLVRQNLGIAVVYNCIAIPIAVSGHVTPLVAALAMSGSSIVVVANALRLAGVKEAKTVGVQTIPEQLV